MRTDTVVGGAKLTIDGSPQGFTAWRDRPFHKPVGNYRPGYVGFGATGTATTRFARNSPTTSRRLAGWSSAA